MVDRILSGMRPTGRLHIGHIEGVLRNWLKLQAECDAFYFIADWHAMTTKISTENIIRDSYEMIKDWLAMGLTPHKSTIFVQSLIPEHAELHLAFSMIINLSRLERVPTFKNQMKDLKGVSKRELSEEEEKEVKSKISYGFLGYPVLQAADVLMYKAEGVPIGHDQLPHIELTREIARKFNSRYKPIFPIPKPILSEAPRILGTDGRKMSKSYDNCILPTDDAATLEGSITRMITDPVRATRKYPGNPDICSVYDLHKIYNRENEVDIAKRCQVAEIGCVECKKMLPDIIHKTYEGFRERRKEFDNNENIKKILLEGSEKARSIARQTMEEVKKCMFINY